MSVLDEIAQKRADSQQRQAGQQTHQESIGAILGSGKEIVQATDNLAKVGDIDRIISQLKQIQLDQLITNQSRENSNKPPVILTDQTDLGDKMNELGDKVAETIKQLDSTDNDKQQIELLRQLNTSLTAYMHASEASNKADTASDKALVAAVKALKVSPVINVPAPNVTVEPTKVDFSPLQDTIKQYFAQDSDEPTGIDLDCYRAQDIYETGDTQYVGFVNPDGGWYIIENKVNENSLRYVFGSNNYTKAFKKAAQYQYMLLNEAVNAL